MNSLHIKKWSARRSGDCITIRGFIGMGDQVSLTNVVEIKLGATHPIAVCKDGSSYELIPFEPRKTAAAA